MLDVDTFLTTLYVTLVDDFCQSYGPERRPQDRTRLSARARSSSPSPSSPGGRAWPARGTSTATPRPTSHTDAFPSLPERSQFNRLVRSHTELIEAFFLHLAALLEVRKCP